MADFQDPFNYDGRDPEFYSLAGLVAELCDRVGMPPGSYDATRLDAVVDGFLVSSDNPAFTYIRTLAEVFFFDPSNYDGILHFIERGAPTVATIDPDEVLDDVDESEEHQKKDTLSVPKVLHLQYMDLSGGLQPDLQRSERYADNRSTGEVSTQTPVILRANDSHRIAVISHKISIEEQKGEYHFSLPDSYIELTVGDCILYRGNRLRIFELLIEDGFQRYKAVFDRKTAYTSRAVGIAIPPPEEPTQIAPGPTRIEPLGIHILTGADDFLGYYIAVSGERESWRGAKVELSLDGGQNYINSSTTIYDVIMGDLATQLPSHSRYYPDENNSFQVEIQTPHAEFQSASLTDMMNRINLCLVGDELINVGNVNEVSPGVWEFDYLLRGRKGTPIETHTVGTRFLLMERDMMAYIPAETFDLGQTLTFRATSSGSNTTTTTSMVFNGQSQTERKPAYLTVVRDGNDLTISWQGVGRLGGRSEPRHGDYFDGYRVEVDGQTIDTQSTSANVTVNSGQHTVKVYQRNKFTGNGPAAEITA